jgi:hypothetical protein
VLEAPIPNNRVWKDGGPGGLIVDFQVFQHENRKATVYFAISKVPGEPKAWDMEQWRIIFAKSPTGWKIEKAVLVSES